MKSNKVGQISPLNIDYTMTYVALLYSKHVVDRHALRLIHKFDKHCHVLIEENL